MKHLASLLALTVALFVASPLPLSADAARQDKPADVAGKWALTVETAGGTGTPSVELKQDGETLTGTYSSQVFGEQKVTGTIKGNAISFGFTGSFGGNSVAVTYSGTVDGTSMKGKVTLGDIGEGTFTGKKQ
jgi:hypothetical protein